MHANEIKFDKYLVSQLIKDQFPQWSDLPLQALCSSGTSNQIFRLGDRYLVRLPRVLDSAGQIEKEQQWLPKLASFLPLTVPTLLGCGVATDYYPCPWSVYQWIEGANATIEKIANPHEAATALGRFITALQKIDATHGPVAGEHNFYRGVSLQILDETVRKALGSLRGIINVDAASNVWNRALQVPEWNGPLKWIHGDLHSSNLLAHNRKLSAVIDFGGLGVGDPACDVMVAWTYLSSQTRQTFRNEIEVDDATWARGRGWALYLGLIALPYYLTSNPVLADIARYSITEVLDDAVL